MKHLPPHSTTDSFASPTCSSVEEGIECHFDDLMRRARYLTGSQAEAHELVQETAVRALRFKHTYHKDTHARAWLMRVMQNLFISQRRRNSMERRVREQVRFDPNSWVTRQCSEQKMNLSRPVLRAIDQLPECLSQVVRMVDLCDFSYREAALEQGVPVGTVMSRLHRGRSRLAQQLQSTPHSKAQKASVRQASDPNLSSAA